MLRFLIMYYKNIIMRHHFYPPEEFRRKFERPEEYLPNLIKGKGVIVDYGCGNGFYCKYLINYATKLYCIDINEVALREVKEKIKDAIVLTSPEEINDNSVDYVLLANSFHDMEDKEYAVRQIRRILKEGGKVIIIDWKKENTPIGPPLTIRMSEKEYLEWFKDFKLINRFSPTPYHFGLILEK